MVQSVELSYSFNDLKMVRKWWNVQPERFEKPAARFPIKRDERTSMQRTTLSKSGSEAAL